MIMQRKRINSVKSESGNVKKLKTDVNMKISKNTSTTTKSIARNKKTRNIKESEVNSAKSGDKTDWRKFKEEKKELKLKRKQTKAIDLYEISAEAKKLYEALKCHSAKNKTELVKNLFNLLDKNDALRKMCLAHDTARIVQCMFKNATAELHASMSEKLLPHIVEMSLSKYAHFCVQRMCKHGTADIKSRLTDSLMGNIVKMASHNLASKILDNVYLNMANPKQQACMRQEFYGELYRRNKDVNVKQLSDTYSQTANMKASVLSTVKAHLDRLANKKLIDNSLVHHVMLEYVNACDEEKMEETITNFAPLIPHMLTTKEGCQAAMICLFKATSKHRRAIIKAVKEHLVKICTHEQGHVFVIALINCLDDTKAIKKAIFDQIQPNLEELMENAWGRRVIEWFITPADTNCFHPSFIAAIDDGLKYSKKDKNVRRKEIFEAVQDTIANAIVENAKFWLSDRHIALVTANVLKRLNGDSFDKAAKALATVVADPFWSVKGDAIIGAASLIKNNDVEEIISAANKLKRQKQKSASQTADSEDADCLKFQLIPGIEEAGIHIVIKKIIKNDKERLTEHADANTFGAFLIHELNADTLPNWIKVNRACFLLLNIYETNNKNIQILLKELLLPYNELLKLQKTSGAQLLLKKIN